MHPHQTLSLCTAEVDAIVAAAGDAMAEALDKEFGAAVTDPAVYRAHAAKYEVRSGLYSIQDRWPPRGPYARAPACACGRGCHLRVQGVAVQAYAHLGRGRSGLPPACAGARPGRPVR